MTDTMWFVATVVIVFSIALTWGSLAFVLWLSARASGWAEIAAQYGKAFPESSTPRLLPRIGMGRQRPLWYNNAVRARIQNHTLHLRPTILAKIAHKPIAIPLADLEFESKTPTPKEGHAAAISKLPNRKIWFSPKDAAWVQAAQGRQ